MTLAAAAATLALSAAFGRWGPLAARQLPPRQATWLLSAGGLVASLAGLIVLGLLGSLLVGEQPTVAQEGHWSVAALRQHAPEGRSIAVGAALLTAAVCARAVVVGVRRARAVLIAYRSCRRLPAEAGELIVVPGASVGAYAVPGRPGRIVAGQHLLKALPADQRRALLAHERAHLAHGHHWHLAAVTISAALNPLLRPLRGAARCATERWSDEAAGAAVGDRRLVAQALAAASRLGRPPHRGALAAADAFVAMRVQALLGPPPGSSPRLVRVGFALLVAAVAAAVVVTKQTEHLYEFARHVDR